jgi:hypothetical protein
MEPWNTSIEDIASQLDSAPDAKRLLDAFEYAKKAHDGQLRKSGEPYILHPTAVALKLWNTYGDIDLTIAGLLHDTTEDCGADMDSIYSQFGDMVGFLVDAVDKNRRGFLKHDVIFEDKIERLLWAGLQDIRVLLLKIADREHNIDTLKHLQNDKQVRMAFETQAIYKPLKHVLGLYENRTIDEIKKRFADCLCSKHISEPREIKACLYSMSFRDFSDEMFDLVYNNSHKIVWEVEDKAYLKELSKNKEFEKHVNIENMWTDGERFKAEFTFDKGYIMDANAGLKVSSYKK